ncbi:MAG TPA: hypothetical protein VGN42_28320, partial [Pirellulales bacterium]|nr:hypothetical protein [Pirellulales bacterium]
AVMEACVFSRHGQAMNAATTKSNVIAAKAPSSSQPANAERSTRFSTCQQNYEAIHCPAMPRKTHPGDAPDWTNFLPPRRDP